MRHHQDGREFGSAQHLHRDGKPERSRRIELYVLCHRSFVVWVAPAQDRGMMPGAHRIWPEADRTFVIDEYVAGEQVAPAARRRAQAEVVLLAVTVAERIRVEQADAVQCGTADEHAAADRGRQGNAAPGIGGAARRIELRNAEAEGWRTRRDAWITADRRVVGEG